MSSQGAALNMKYKEMYFNLVEDHNIIKKK